MAVWKGAGMKSFILAALILTVGVGASAATFGDFEYSSDGTSITIMDYQGAGGEVTIPDTIEGLPVTSIGQEAFEECSDLTSVVIPDSITSIGESAFWWCW
ncbi:MAG: leucine-rich repeat protein, partial [Lentisphaerae bacterium]|nr:leucine-rich repeat protein [Lentisphaerota bacterium]